MVDLSFLQNLPTRDNPMLVGLMVDVSGSMVSSIRSSTGKTKGRLDSFNDALEDFVRQGKTLCQDEMSQQIIPLFKLFAYGFGFGNPLARFLGAKGPAVRDLLDRSGGSGSTIAIDQLFENWDAYRSNVVGMIPQMFGGTPMLEAFTKVKERFSKEKEQGSFIEPPILFVLSDGEPTDGTSDSVLTIAEDLKKSGVFVISCYVTDKDITSARKLYGTVQPDWPEGAKLMFECASAVPTHSTFKTYLREYGWEFEENTHIFAQVNQSEILKEFLGVILSPLQNQRAVSIETPDSFLSADVPGALSTSSFATTSIENQSSKKNTRIFVSYSHQDRKYLADDSLLGYLKGLEREGFEFWSDQRILSGEIWDDVIQSHINSADIALVLVSQAFLNSKYCFEREITAFIENRKRSGLRIFPVILSACDWKNHSWLRSTQFQPIDGKNIESDFRDKGKRAQLFLKILEDIRNISKNIEQGH